MTEAEARKIFQDKLAICDVLGLDVRQACLDAGVPGPTLDRIIRDHAVKTAATTRCITDPSVMPVTRAGQGAAGPGEDTGFLCLGQKLTGLPMIVWVLQGGASGFPAAAAAGPGGSPYLRVQADHSTSPRTGFSARVSLAERPVRIDGAAISAPDFVPLAEFIRINREALLAHWGGSESPVRLLRRIIRVS